MKNFFKLIGWQRLLLLFLMLIVIRIGVIVPFFEKYLLLPTISSSLYLVFAFATVFIMAGNNVADRFFDEKFKIFISTKENPKTKDYPDLKRLQFLYLALQSIGLVAMIYVTIFTRLWEVLAISVFIALSGYYYALRFKRESFFGNLTVAVIYTVIFFLPFLMELMNIIPTEIYQNLKILQDGIINLGKIVGIICIMIFLLTLLWDFTGDVVNMPEDKLMDVRTFAVKIGEKSSKCLMYIVSAIIIAVCGGYLALYYSLLGVVQVVSIAIIFILPLIYYIVTLIKAQKPEDYNFLYTLLGMMYISLVFMVSFIRYMFINGQIR